MAVWWEGAPAEERRAVANIPSVERSAGGGDLSGVAFSPLVRDALLEALLASGSNLVLIPIQDVFGWPNRINVPATVIPENWTFRLPWAVDHLEDEPVARERRTVLRALADRYGRR